MSPAFEALQQQLKRLPGLGFRSAERIALHLLVEKPDKVQPLIDSLQYAAARLKRCPITGNITETEFCPIYADTTRDRHIVCLVETVSDLYAFERAGVYQGTYHVLHGKLSPLHGVQIEDLNLTTLLQRVRDDSVTELILALSNDVEGEATCHYIQDILLADIPDLTVSRIGFGLPSGSGVTFVDPSTLRSALEGRR